MNEENKIENSQQPSNSTAEGKTAGNGEKLFTQEDVNRIVTERLAKERAKGQPPESENKVQQLQAQIEQNRWAKECADFLGEENLKEGVNYYPAGLVDLLGACPLSEFKDKLKGFMGVYQQMQRAEKDRPVGRTMNAGENSSALLDNTLRRAFGLKRKG